MTQKARGGEVLPPPGVVGIYDRICSSLLRIHDCGRAGQLLVCIGKEDTNSSGVTFVDFHRVDLRASVSAAHEWGAKRHR